MGAAVRHRPTRRQLEVLRAYIAAGSIAGAAETLDIAESTARQHLSALYRRTGLSNAAQAAYRLGQAEKSGMSQLVRDRTQIHEFFPTPDEHP
jgi:DNA-binding NarL/FixJ family response regulator